MRLKLQLFPIEKRAPATESFPRKFSGVRNSHVSRAAVSGFCHILHRSGSIKGRGGPVSFAPRGVSRAGQLRGPQGARPRVGPASAPPRAPAPTRSARGRTAPPGPLPPLPTAGARSLMATPERTGSCLTSGGTSTAVTPPVPGSLTVASAGHAGMMSREEDRKSRVQNAGERDE